MVDILHIYIHIDIKTVGEPVEIGYISKLHVWIPHDLTEAHLSFHLQSVISH